MFLPPKHERTQDSVKVENQDITPGGHEQHDFGGDIIVDFVAVRPLQKPSEPLQKSLSHVLKKKKQRGLSLTQQFRDTPLDLPVILPQFGIDEDLEGRQCTYPGELLARGPDGSLSPVIIPPNNLRASSSKSSELLREPNSISSQPDLSSQPDSSCYVSEDSDPSLKEKSESCLSGDHETPKDPETPEKKNQSLVYQEIKKLQKILKLRKNPFPLISESSQQIYTDVCANFTQESSSFMGKIQCFSRKLQG